MIVYYLGIPGSGKSYSGVNTIYNNFSTNKDAVKDLKKDYINCYTNINEFKFDKLQNVYKLDIDSLLVSLQILYEMYKDKKTDQELIQKATELNIYKTLFVIDECHNLFDVNKPLLVWWLTYHRHLYHDLILITQNLSLINTKYKPLAEAFYKAKPSSLTLNKKYFNYIYYTDSRMSQASKVNIKKVKKNKNVFDLYHSGDSVDSKNVILYFITIALIFFVFALLYFFYFTSTRIPEKSNDKNTTKQINIPKSINTKSLDNSITKHIKDDYSTKIFKQIHCTLNNCILDDVSIPPQLISKFINMEFIHSYYDQKVTSSYHIFYVSIPKDFYSFLISNKDNNFENNSNTSDPINFFNSK
jgi:zona occludens toxin